MRGVITHAAPLAEALSESRRGRSRKKKFSLRPPVSGERICYPPRIMASSAFQLRACGRTDTAGPRSGSRLVPRIRRWGGRGPMGARCGGVAVRRAASRRSSWTGAPAAGAVHRPPPDATELGWVSWCSTPEAASTSIVGRGGGYSGRALWSGCREHATLWKRTTRQRFAMTILFCKGFSSSIT